MGFLRRTFGLAEAVEVVQSAPTFEVDVDPALLYGGATPMPAVPIPARVSRREAMSVPAVKRARDLICGTLGQLPLNLVGPNYEPQQWALFEQPEADVPRAITMTMLAEDMLFEQVGWWRTTLVGWHNKPVQVRRLEPRSVQIRKDLRVYVSKDGTHSQGWAEEWVPDEQLIRFDSPNDGLLTAGARAIRALLALDDLTLRYADGAPPLDYFVPADGADPADDDDVIGILNAWYLSRKARTTGYVPASLEYKIAGWDPEKLQLHEARQHAVLEIARLTGLDPEVLGVSTTSRTYANQFDRRKDYLDFTVGPYRAAIEGRLTMPDVTPRGYESRFDLSDFLRSDDKTRMEVYSAGKSNGAWTKDEIRAAERKPALTAAEDKAANPVPPALPPAPAPTPAEEPAND